MTNIILGESIVRVTHPKCSSNTAYTKKDKKFIRKLFINSVPASTRLLCQVAPKEGNEVHFINNLIITQSRKIKLLISCISTYHSRLK